MNAWAASFRFFSASLVTGVMGEAASMATALVQEAESEPRPHDFFPTHSAQAL